MGQKIPCIGNLLETLKVLGRFKMVGNGVGAGGGSLSLSLWREFTPFLSRKIGLHRPIPQDKSKRIHVFFVSGNDFLFLFYFFYFSFQWIKIIRFVKVHT